MALISLNLTGIANGLPNNANDVVNALNAIVTQCNGNLDPNNIDQTDTYTWTGSMTFNAGVCKIKGAGSGIASLQNENTSNSRTITFPDMGTSYDLFPIERAPIGTVVNGAFSYNAGTFSVVGADGNALSASNKLKAVIKKSTGAPLVVTFTSSPSFQDDAHASDSDFVGTGTMSWGTTAAVAWGNDMPFLLGICTADDSGTTPVMVIARGPVATTGASTNIGYHDNAPSSASQNNVFALTASNITATHANRPITWIGSFRMTKSASDDWTVTALDYGDGINNFYNFGTREYDMVVGQMGVVSGRYFVVSGGTAPTYTATNFYKYTISMLGFVNCIFQFINTSGGTAGSGTNACAMTSPYRYKDYTSFGSGTKPTIGTCYISNLGSVDTLGNILFDSGTSGLIHLAYQSTILTAAATMSGNNQGNVSRKLMGSFSYQAF